MRKKKCLQSATRQNRTARSATLRKLLTSGGKKAEKIYFPRKNGSLEDL